MPGGGLTGHLGGVHRLKIENAHKQLSSREEDITKTGLLKRKGSCRRGAVMPKGLNPTSLGCINIALSLSEQDFHRNKGPLTYRIERNI